MEVVQAEGVRIFLSMNVFVNIININFVHCEFYQRSLFSLAGIHLNYVHQKHTIADPSAAAAGDLPILPAFVEWRHEFAPK